MALKLGDVPIGEYYLYVTFWQNNEPRYFADALYSFPISADNKAELDRITTGYASSNQPGSPGFPTKVVQVLDRDQIKKLRLDYSAVH